MEKHIFALVVLCSLFIVSMGVDKIDESPKGVELWISKLSQKKEKLTKLHFFFHDTFSGKTPTAFPVAQANNATASPNTLFGLVVLIDDPLTVGPELNSSSIIGRAQGLYSFSDLKEPSVAMNINLVFTNGMYNGSTLSIVGRDPILEQYREMSVVGGSGVFRLARGIATAQTTWFNMTTNDAVLEFDVVVLHY